MLLLLAAVAGCTRAHYRESADRETYPIIQERVVAPAFDVGRTRVEPAAGSRLADPFDPDRPPKPPDDPVAAKFMERPGGLRGSQKWGEDGHTNQIEGPGWLDALGLQPDGTLKLDPEKAVHVALLNSREYQTALENVYLAALALTLNRFEFDVRWFGRNATTYTADRLADTNALTVNSDLGFTRDFAAGGQLLADFANALVFQFGNGSTEVRSNLIFTFTQPLLRGAGRQVRLEGLTQTERDVLYAVRDFARFRKQFWAETAIQSQGGGAYLDLLLAVQTVRNAQANLKLQEESYRLTEELFRSARASAVEFDQAYRGLLNARQAVINTDVALQSALDAYKLRLGLPPRLPVEIDDSLLNQFVLTDPAAEKLRDDLEAFQRERLRELDEVPTVASLTAAFAALKVLAGRAPAAVASADADLRRWEARLAVTAPDADPEQASRAKAAFAELSRALPEVAADLRLTAAAIDRHRVGVTEETRKASWEALTQDVKAVLAAVDAAVAVQTQARIYLIELPDVRVEEADALACAKANRLDLMNQLAGVTDAWRKVTVAANALRSDLDVVATADLGTDRDHRRPFDFAAEASRYTVGLRLDGPLNRQAERNAYRASLIAYQRAKRAYVALSDQIELQVRNDIRQLRRLRQSFEIARQSVISAARQYENARLRLLGPRNRQAGGAATDQTTLEIQNALRDLLENRNALAASLINYEQQRVQLLLDLEELQLDPRGYPTNVGRPLRAADPGGPPEPIERLDAPPPAPGAGDPARPPGP